MCSRAILFSSSLLLASGCANLMPHQAGQTLGAILGGAVAPGIGVPMGSVLGSLAGMVIQRKMNKADEKRERVELGRHVKPGDAPGAIEQASAPRQPARVWIDETSQNGRMIAGHYEILPLP